MLDFLLLRDRENSIPLTRMRHRCSSLNADLYNVNIIPYSACGYGALFETVEHFFFESNLYNIQRQRLIKSINPNLVIDFTLLTNGSPLCEYGENKGIILAVLKYIEDTHRFSVRHYCSIDTLKYLREASIAVNQM